jgi:Predicted outer membrane lipoprotein
MQSPTKPLIAGLAAVLALSSGAAMADYGHAFRDRAKVVSSTPVYEQINEPRRECWTEYESREVYRDGNNTGGAILGAVVGGLVGSTVGKGNGKVAAAAVGAATGAVVGDRWNDRGGSHAYEERPVERCRVTDNYRQEIVGYDVTYRYNGRNYTTRLPYDPGEWLSLDVSFSVADHPRSGRWNESRSRW